MKNLTDYFKIYHGGWEHPATPEELLGTISFVFTMKDFEGLYFKTKEPCDNYGIGMDCFQFAFDVDNGIYINDGDMKFNDFMGRQITDSGSDAVGFIRNYLIDHNLQNLIK